MLSSARPLFEHVPGSFADPVGLADQQGPGAVSLIVARYPDEDDCLALGQVYDCFVAVSGQLVAVARTTPDYRFPVTPTAALDRFLTARDSGRAVFVSLFETTEPDCARFLETVFYSECLKLHVSGPDSAALVADQLDRCGCGSGILELNDFSDPASPRIQLIDLDVLAAAQATADAAPGDTVPGGTAPGGTATGDTEWTDPKNIEPATAESVVIPPTLRDVLAGHLHGLSGRVLLYDRAKNRAAIPGRAGGASFDLQAAIDEAARLADARRTPGTPPAAPATLLDATTDAQPTRQSERVEAYLADRAHAPRYVPHPQTSALSSLIGELTGAAPAAPFALAGDTPRGDDDAEEGHTASGPSGDGQQSALPEITLPVVSPAVVSPAAVIDPAAPAEWAQPVVWTEAPAPSTQPDPAQPSPAPAATTPAETPPAAPAPHPLAHALDELRVEVYALFADATGAERAQAHEAHVCEAHAIPSPVPPDRVLDYLRALLCDAPPRRWHFFKQRRHDVRDAACRKLLAFHAAHNHTEHDVLHEATRLWSRLRK